MQTIQQKRAQFALTEVRKISTDTRVPDKHKDEYKAYAAALPAMIHMNGLGQAAAFYKAKGSSEKGFAYKQLYNLLSKWLTKDGQPYKGYTDLLDGVTKDDMHKYRLAQAEAQALMDWVKKFASAYMVAGSTEQAAGGES